MTYPTNIILFATDPEEEHLSHESPEAAAEALLDGLDPAQIAALPDDLPVYGWSRKSIIGYLDPQYTAQGLLEQLDDEYGDPDGEGDAPTPAMLEAAKVLIAVIEAEYVPWACDRCWKGTVNIRELKARP